MNSGPGDNSSVGIDPGLDKLAQTSDGNFVKNPRNLKYADARQLALSIILSGEGKNKYLSPEEQRILSSQVYRHDARQKRRVLDSCRKLAAKLCRKYEFIGIEKNSGVALGSGHRYTGATYLLTQCLIHRCGSHRVREVEPYYNSQTCSQCGHVDKITWERKIGNKDQTCTCAACGYTADRDLNAARNVNRKLRESLGLEN
jgi:putative transposase